LASFALAVVASAMPCRAWGQVGGVVEVVTLRSGYQLQGRLGAIGEIGPAPPTSAVEANPIILIDDGLRRSFVPKQRVTATAPVDELMTRFSIRQNVHGGGVGAMEIRRTSVIQPFDDYGRRIMEVEFGTGRRVVAQGITEITPRYCVVEALADTNLDLVRWDMRIATTSIPSDVLVKLLHRQIIDPTSPNERLRLVEFLTQAERYAEARVELAAVANDFPGLGDELKRMADVLNQAVARQMLNEARQHLEAGQPRLAEQLLEPLVTSPSVAGEILAEVGQIRQTLQDEQANVNNAQAAVAAAVEAVVSNAELDDARRASFQAFADEIAAVLNPHNLDRLSTFLRLADDATLDPEQRLALAISGWVIGGDASLDNMAVAESLWTARGLVNTYLQSLRPDERHAALDELKRLEAGSVEYVARIVANLAPPWADRNPPSEPGQPLEIIVDIPGAGGGKRSIKYLALLPPEYDPYRRYPCILTLAGETGTPLQQLQFWAGEYHEKFGLRIGQATRNGYIVVAPDWRQPTQISYEYSADEHAAVLTTLRDALRRFAIDTDRVFLTGHYIGADAAWDIALAHPEHWAGAILFAGRADKYVDHYWQNARDVLPMYFVTGERDYELLERNSVNWNRGFRHAGFDQIVVEYQGRGSEMFSEEIKRVFDWMRLYRRNPAVPKFQCSTMRPWDNYFWWFEIQEFPPQRIVHPAAWGTTGRLSDWLVEGEIRTTDDNKINLQGAIDAATVWLSPELIDFEKRVEIMGASGRFKDFVRPSVDVILEDARRRADRQHPFWARIERINKTWQVPEADAPSLREGLSN